MERIKVIIMKTLFYLFRIFSVDENKIVFCSYLGRGYGGEGKIICDKIMKDSYDIVWLVRNMDESMPKGVRKVKYLSLRSIYEQVTAKIWVDNRRKPLYVRKRRSQHYIQVWHGDACIKYVEKDAEDQLPINYIKGAKNDSKMANAMLAGTKWRRQNYLDSFWFDGEILEGNLYNEYFLESRRAKYIERVRAELRVPENFKLVIYAPTFRKNRKLNFYNIDYKRLLSSLEQKFGGKWVVAVRLHPNIADMNISLKYSDYILNASEYPQINDLILASEILITDYSGCMFDGYRAGKKVIIYASDYEEYTKNDRGMYFMFEDLPAPIAMDNDELEDVVMEFDSEKYEVERACFINRIGYYENDGSEVVAKWIKEKIKEVRL